MPSLQLSYEMPYTYLITKRGGYYHAREPYGKSKYHDDKLDAVINSVLGDMPSGGGKVVLGLTGEHTLYASILNQNQPVTLAGLGSGEFTVAPEGITILKAKNALNDKMIRSVGASGTKAPLYLRDLTLDGNRANQAVAAPAISLEGYCRTSILERVGICRVLGEPIKSTSVYNMNFWISKCQLEDCSKGVYLSGIGYYLYVINTYFINLDTSLLYVSGSQWIHFLNSDFMAAYYHGLWIDDCRQFNIIGCNFSGNNKASGAFNDIELQGACESGTIIGNTSRTQTGYADKPKYCLHISATADRILATSNIFKEYDTAAVFTEVGGNANGIVNNNITA